MSTSYGWVSRTLAVVRLEWRRQLTPVRLVWLVALAGLPVVVSAIRVFGSIKFGFTDPTDPESLGELRLWYANFYHGMIVRLVLFFGCLSVFVGQIRGEVEQRVLHYSLLTPVPRWLLVVGKYLAGLALAWGFFVAATAASLAAVHIPFGLGGLVRGSGFDELAAYVAMTMLGCLAYGALFLGLGSLLKGPGYLVAVFFIFEWVQFLLPPLLKQLSVVHYLKSLTPVPISEGPFALLADPVPGWQTVAKLLLYTTVALALAGWATTRRELNYSSK